MSASILETLSLQLRRHGKSQALLFTGAGFSTGAENVTGNPIPAGKDLIAFFRLKTGEDIDDLGILSRVYVEKFGVHSLFNFLTTEFRTRTVRPYHEKTLAFPWRSVYTTNYDDVSEIAATQSKVPTRSYSRYHHPSDVAPNALPVIHLNGYIHDITFQDFQNKITLTNVSYLSDSISKSPWGEKFRSDILTSPCIVFVGYSMFDLDIARIVYSFPEMKDRIYFVTNPNPPRSLEIKLQDFGRIIDIGTEKFGEYLAATLGMGIETRELYFTNIEKFTPLKNTPAPLTDAIVRDFLVLGDLRQDVLASDIVRGSSNYAFPRDCISKVCQIISSGDKSNIVLHSNMGNGKSVCADMIGHKLTALGNHVFKIRNNTKKAYEELASTRGMEGKKIFIVDDIFSHLNTIKAIQSFNFPAYAVIATARSTLFDLRLSEVDGLFRGDVYDFSLDTLSKDERNSLIKLFDVYGYWRHLQCSTASQKDFFITNKCSSELRALLLHFLDTQPIKQNITALFRDVTSPAEEDIDRIQRLIIVAQMINLSGHEPRFEVLSEILEFDSFRCVNHAPNPYREFVKQRNGKLLLQSPVLSEYIIKNIMDGDFFVETMIEVVTRLDEIFDNEAIYAELIKVFVRYSFLEGFLPERNKREFLIKYYENVKVLRTFKRDPLFWLQYAIARLSLREFEEAKQMFEVSYSFSKARGYTENRHLDNQFARFLLESRTYSDLTDDYFDTFKRAHQILWRQMAAEPLSYNPYRVARNYYELALRRKDQLSQADKLQIIRCCLDILKKISGAPERLKNYPAVKECERGMKATANLLREGIA